VTLELVFDAVITSILVLFYSLS